LSVRRLQVLDSLMWYSDFNKAFFTCKSHIKIHGLRLKVISCAYVKKVQLHCTYLYEIQKHSTTLYVPSSCFEFHLYLTLCVESTDRNSSTHLWGLHCTKCLQNPQFLMAFHVDVLYQISQKSVEKKWKLVLWGRKLTWIAVKIQFVPHSKHAPFRL